MSDVITWEYPPKLAGTSAIVLVRSIDPQESKSGTTCSPRYEYQLLHLFRLSEKSKWSIDGPLVAMQANNFNVEDYAGTAVIEHNGMLEDETSSTKDQGLQ